MSKLKDRLMAALNKDPALMYEVWFELNDEAIKFCGPWVALRDFNGKATGEMAREDHTGEVCAWIKEITPHIDGPTPGMAGYEWNAAFIPPDDMDDDAATNAEVGTGGICADYEEALKLADEAMVGAGWTMVPEGSWVPVGEIFTDGVMPDPEEGPKVAIETFDGEVVGPWKRFPGTDKVFLRDGSVQTPVATVGQLTNGSWEWKTRGGHRGIVGTKELAMATVDDLLVRAGMHVDGLTPPDLGASGVLNAFTNKLAGSSSAPGPDDIPF